MSQTIKRAVLNRLLKGDPKKVTRGTIQRIVILAKQMVDDGIAYFPYYTKNKPEHAAERASDTRRMLEREAGPFYYTTGNWEHLFDGNDVMAVWQDEAINESLSDAGFRVRVQDTAARNADAAEPEGLAETVQGAE